MKDRLSNAAIVEDIHRERAQGLIYFFRECRIKGVTMGTIQELIDIANGLSEFPGVFWYDRNAQDFCYGADT